MNNASKTIISGQRRLAAGIAAFAALGGCASFPALRAPSIDRQEREAETGASPVYADERTGTPIQILSGALPPSSEREHAVARASATPADVEALLSLRDVQASLPPQPLPQFIDTVFGEILDVPYATGPGVAQRHDIIALRGPASMSNRQFFALTQAALAQYGIAVIIEGGAVRIVQDAVLSGQSPVFIRSRTTPDTPSSSRPVMQFFAVSTLDVEALMGLLDQAYPNRGSVRFTAQPATNTLLISGNAREVGAAATVVRQLDQPHFSGGQVARVEPVFLSPEQLADALQRVLATEGYRVSNPIEPHPNGINLLPLQNANQLLIFAHDLELLDRALFWVSELDRASASGDTAGLFIYTARNTSAEELGALVASAGAGAGPGAPAQNPPEVAVRRIDGQRIGSRPQEGMAGPTNHGALTVDPGGNRLLFHGTASEFERLRVVLEQLDTPPQQVLIEITVAEVTLTDETRFGVEWYLERAMGNGVNMRADTRGGSERQNGGLGVLASQVFSRGRVEAALNAFASNRNLNILSTPRLVTRSGGVGEFLVGTDVPIITSQRASNNQTGGDTDVLQTVQYRQTGVILNVRPVVYGDGRIDIELYQEVSSQQPNDSADINSPLILNRSVTTQVSLEEGMTAVIGGIMQDNISREQRGIPGLKDLPFIGAAFRSDTVSGDKVELVILVTPYIIRDSEDMQAITETMTNSMNMALRRRGTQVYTLYPWQQPFGATSDHGARMLAEPREPAGPTE
jgi:general secretion pathway protein D